MDDRVRQAMEALKRGTAGSEKARAKAEDRAAEPPRNRLHLEVEDESERLVSDASACPKCRGWGTATAGRGICAKCGGSGKKRDESDKPVNATTVYEWFLAGVREHIDKNVVMGRWNAKRNTLAKTMLDDYGPALVKEAVEYFCKEWNDIAKQVKARGLPTIELLWGMRDTIFGEIQMGKRGFSGRKEQMNKDEWKGESGKDGKGSDPDVGW